MSTDQLAPTAAWLTLLDLLRWRAASQSERRAYTFLLDGEAEEVHITYGDLDRRARAIGAILQQQIAPGDRALLLYPPGLDYIAAFFGCLYAAVIAVPVYPPNPARLARSLPRLHDITLDACPAAILTTSSILSVATKFADQDATFATMQWLATDMLSGAEATAWSEPRINGDTLAFLQYTSGSTMAPRGVMVSHENLLHNEGIIQRAFELTAKSISVSWLPMYHDMGLIGNVLQPLYSGFPCVLMSPTDFLQKPVRWLQAITRYRATTSGGPNFAYDLCVNHITPEQRATLDLQSWDVAFNGAEPIRHETLERFSAYFKPCGFRHEAFFPCYGLAEATLFVSGGPKSAPPLTLEVNSVDMEHNRVAAVAPGSENTSTLLSSGQISSSQQVVIVHPDTRLPCKPDHVGEIWISSTSVAQGYWHQSEATTTTFQAHFMDTGKGPFLRTGDLGFIRDGNLFITSRLKDLVIVRGRNHAPQDIERTVETCHPALRPGCGAAFSVEMQGEEQLVVVQELKRQYLSMDSVEAAAAIRQAVGEQHELHVYAVVLLKTGTLPKTSSGKVRRRACRDKFLHGGLQITGESILTPHDERATTPGTVDDATGTLLEALLATESAQRFPLLVTYLQQQVARAVGVRPGQVSIDQPIMALGIDSLKVLELKQRVETELGVQIPIDWFIEYPTITQLAEPLLTSFEHSLGNLWTEIIQLTDEEVDVRLAQLTGKEQ